MPLSAAQKDLIINAFDHLLTPPNTEAELRQIEGDMMDALRNPAFPEKHDFKLLSACFHQPTKYYPQLDSENSAVSTPCTVAEVQKHIVEYLTNWLNNCTRTLAIKSVECISAWEASTLLFAIEQTNDHAPFKREDKHPEEGFDVWEPFPNSPETIYTLKRREVDNDPHSYTVHSFIEIYADVTVTCGDTFTRSIFIAKMPKIFENDIATSAFFKTTTASALQKARGCAHATAVRELKKLFGENAEEKTEINKYHYADITTKNYYYSLLSNRILTFSDITGWTKAEIDILKNPVIISLLESSLCSIEAATKFTQNVIDVITSPFYYAQLKAGLIDLEIFIEESNLINHERSKFLRNPKVENLIRLKKLNLIQALDIPDPLMQVITSDLYGDYFHMNNTDWNILYLLHDSALLLLDPDFARLIIHQTISFEQTAKMIHHFPSLGYWAKHGLVSFSDITVFDDSAVRFKVICSLGNRLAKLGKNKPVLFYEVQDDLSFDYENPTPDNLKNIIDHVNQLAISLDILTYDVMEELFDYFFHYFKGSLQLKLRLLVASPGGERGYLENLLKIIPPSDDRSSSRHLIFSNLIETALKIKAELYKGSINRFISYTTEDSPSILPSLSMMGEKRKRTSENLTTRDTSEVENLCDGIIELAPIGKISFSAQEEKEEGEEEDNEQGLLMAPAK